MVGVRYDVKGAGAIAISHTSLPLDINRISADLKTFTLGNLAAIVAERKYRAPLIGGS